MLRLLIITACVILAAHPALGCDIKKVQRDAHACAQTPRADQSVRTCLQASAESRNCAYGYKGLAHYLFKFQEAVLLGSAGTYSTGKERSKYARLVISQMSEIRDDSNAPAILRDRARTIVTVMRQHAAYWNSGT